ncbi:hypothetical protein [Stappia indica]|uniref:Uncharacterized protein n=1 Tax=Stappia indica TaxID=538381 RepID=A0A857CB31_9HYPH|nr:hypothetical protein [Stappia indica]QGZ36234.1 hypothetical protein GH266_18115 [Stappia indica]
MIRGKSGRFGTFVGQALAVGFGSRAARPASLARAVSLAAGLAVLPAAALAQQASLPEGLSSAYQALDAAWQQAPLSFAALAFTDGAATGYGRYTPRADAVFAAGDTLTVYAEPVGFGHEETAEGYGVRLTAGFELLNTSGQVLAEQTGFADLRADSRNRLREFHATLSFAFEGLRPGDYRLVTTLTDTVSGKTASGELPFTIRASD